MKKLRHSAQKYTHFSLPGAVKLASAVKLVAGALLFAALLSSCEYFTYKRPFADPYYDNNFIAGIGFDRLLAAVDLPPADPDTGFRTPAHGVWDFSYRYDGWDGFEYLALEEVSDTGYETAGGAGFGSVPEGLSPAARVYRLEMLNLAQGGDFEDAADNPASSGLWSTPPNDVPSTFNLVDTGAINGRSIVLSIEANLPVSYRISPLPGAIVPAGLYSLDFRWLAGDSFPSGDANKIRMNQQPEPFSANTETFRASSQFKAQDSKKDELVFDVGPGWIVTIDDITIKKVGGLELRLLLAQGDTEPELKDLLYRFSVWVHADPSVGAHSSPYRLDSLEVQMQATPVSLVSTKPRFRYDPSAAGWQRVEVEVENGNLMFPDKSAEPVMELVIDLDGALPGRVLLAQPELRAYPDGYPE